KCSDVWLNLCCTGGPTRPWKRSKPIHTSTMRKPIPASLRRMFTLPGSLPAVRTFALALALGTYAFASAQVSVFIQQPEANAGPLEFTWSETWGAGIDTIAPIIGNLVLVDDGT